MFAFKWTEFFFKKKATFCVAEYLDQQSPDLLSFPQFSMVYVKELHKPIQVGCVKGFWGEICCSEETKDVSSYHLFLILSHSESALNMNEELNLLEP